jgi:hypothetical protein
VEKLNIAVKPKPQGFRITDGRVIWTGECELPRKPRAGDQASEFLQSFLEDGPKMQKEVEEAAQVRGISTTTLNRAKSRLEIRSRKVGFDGWQWELPHSEGGQNPGSHSEDRQTNSMASFATEAWRVGNVPNKLGISQGEVTERI